MYPFPDRPTLTRRHLLLGSSCAVASLSLPNRSIARSTEEGVDVEALMAAGPLPDLVYGNAAAPVAVVEYSSLTCGHCADFHVNALPQFRKTHIDTGLACLVLREFPFDPRSLAGFMLARCLGGDRTLAMIDLLFKRQEEWSHVDDAAGALLSLARSAGMDRNAFDACLTDRDLQEKVMAIQARGQNEFGVSATPTFFIGGVRHVGALSAAELAALVDARR